MPESPNGAGVEMKHRRRLGHGYPEHKQARTKGLFVRACIQLPLSATEGPIPAVAKRG